VKSFRFSLERVLAWRSSQLTMEESKLERLRAEADAIRRRQRSVVESKSAAESATLGAQSMLGSDLTSLDQLRHWAKGEQRRLVDAANTTANAISTQESAVTDARRRVRLLERLKDRRRTAWSAAQEAELAELAGESAIAQWRRAN
jgi:hypothetical protein